MRQTINKFKGGLLALLICAATPFLAAAPAQAACGGLNQKACPVFKKGPQCGRWLTNVKGTCRPCGGKNQRACPITKKGKACKSGLGWKLGKCVVKKATVKDRLLKDARTRAKRLKPVIRKVAAVLRRVGNKNMIKKLKAALKSKNPVAIHRAMQDVKQRAMQDALYKAGFRTMTVGIQSSIAVAGGYGREMGAAQDIYGKNRADMYVGKTYFGGVILGVGNDLVISAFTDNQRNIAGSAYAAIGNFDVGSGVGVVLWYDKKTLMIKGFSVGIGVGSVGAGGAFGHGTTYLCPSKACEKVF